MSYSLFLARVSALEAKAQFLRPSIESLGFLYFANVVYRDLAND